MPVTLNLVVILDLVGISEHMVKPSPFKYTCMAMQASVLCKSLWVIIIIKNIMILAAKNLEEKENEAQNI